MSDEDRNIVSKLEIVKEMATEASVKQLATVFITYVKTHGKKQVGFTKDSKS